MPSVGNSSLSGGRSPSESQSSSGKWVVPTGFVVALALAVFGVLGLMANRTASDEANLAQEAVNEVRLQEIGTKLAWVHADQLSAYMTYALDGTTPSDASIAEFDLARDPLLQDLAQLAEDDTPTGRSAAEALLQYGQTNIDHLPTSLFNLEYLYFVSQQLVSGGSIARSPLLDLSYASTLPHLVVNDAIAVELVTRDEAAPAWAAEYAQDTFEIVQRNPGWVGPDRDLPLWVPMGPDPAEDSITGTNEWPWTGAEVATIWDYDQWLMSGAEHDFSTEPPASLQETSAARDVASAAIRLVTLEQYASEVSAAASHTGTKSSLLFQAAVAAIILGACTAVGVSVYWRSRYRALANAVSTDALTGAKNRRYLDTEVAGRCRRRHYHHVLAMVDLDRFKLINDTYGHDAGDAMLVATAHRLEAVVQTVIAGDDRATGSVVRLGGDEFVVCIHSPGHLETAEIEAQLRQVSGPIDLGLAEATALEMSLGLAESFEPVDVNDLLKSADLATYEDKRRNTEPAEGIADQPMSASAKKAALQLDLR